MNREKITKYLLLFIWFSSEDVALAALTKEIVDIISVAVVR